MKILVSGGAGFIGTNLSKALIQKNHELVILDNLSPQIHQKSFKAPEGVQFIEGDVRNEADWKKALPGVDVVVHYAAETGTGQSMYEIKKYADVNVTGTAILLDHLVNKNHKIKKIVIASSRAVYGEGKYFCADHGTQYPKQREENLLEKGIYDPVCPVCRKVMIPVPTDENAAFNPASVYGITKLTQEQLVLNVCDSIGIEGVGFRYQNVYGPGQSLKNPYTGIVSIFSQLLQQNTDLNIFEDGRESRDFVNIRDVVAATVLGIEKDNSDSNVYNVGSGVPTTVLEVATFLKQFYNSNSNISITGNYRIGDIRHNFADLEKVKEKLGFVPKVSIEEGLKEFSEWVKLQEPVSLDFEASINELRSKGLFK